MRPFTIEGDGVRMELRLWQVMVERSEAGVGEGTAAVEISALRINMTGKGEKTRQGRVESVGRFMMQYSTTVMGLSEVTDLALESYMQNALITLTHFR